MFAVIRTGGKQYKVVPNDVIRVEKLDGDVGDTVALDEVLALGDDKSQTVGAPLVDGATVAAEVLDQRKDKKVLIFKKKRRHNYRRTKGHRQEITVLRITDILTGGKKPATAKKAAPKKDEAPKAETAAAAAGTDAKAAEDKPAAKAEPAKKSTAKSTTAKKPAASKSTASKSTAAKSTGTKSGAAKKTGGTKAASSKSGTAAKKPAAKKPASKSTKKSEE